MSLIWAVDSLPVHQDLCFNVDHSFIILLSENLNKRTSTLFMAAAVSLTRTGKMEFYFYADHPFIYVLKTASNLLFYGRMTKI
ncbi:hypothetical protein TcasGA2_TC034677 [Tribolium castaneum]|uniref:Serpin domain-containing protein n=1 Tax=Tribolium castaneum TaxID=7070 RepID=A0A139WI95_TRICA|nr:hypothetical protein TcasGA2_TC034677 [Tribolium castaneum]